MSNTEKNATLTLLLKADSGYTSKGESRISANTWGVISAAAAGMFGDLDGPSAVKACNSHDKLKWALGEALDLIDQLDGRDNSCDRRADISDLREVLAAAGTE